MRQKARPVRKVLKLRQLRREREMSQSELARRVNCVTSFISEIENGKARPSLDTATALASEFGVSIEEAFSYVEVPA